MHPNRRAWAHQQRRVRHGARSNDAFAYFNLLTSPHCLSKVESLLPAHRERRFPPTETLSMFIAQALSADGSCQQVVNESSIQRLKSGLPLCSTATGAYCRARQRLPVAMVSALVQHTGQSMAACVPTPWLWQGRPVRLVDGTTLTMPDTPANQAAYPQSRGQKAGLGFPLCRLVGIVCLSSGAVLNAAIGRYQGKGGDEQTLLRTLLDTLAPDDILVGDAYFATYFLLCSLRERGVDAVFEQFGARQRRTDFRRGRQLGPRDHLITLDKPLQKPTWMSQVDYEQAPDHLTVRELRSGGKTLVTTLQCPKKTPKTALKALYRSRWNVELDLRNIKTTLGMERLSCKTPQMVEKEIWITLLGYNLIRRLMTQSALLADRLPRQLSFKHTLQLMIAWHHHGTSIGECDQQQGLLLLIAQQHVGNRPGRIEPRAIKRRPKPFPLLTKPRHIAREQVRKFGHPRKLK
jgi:hypothetical protein